MATKCPKCDGTLKVKKDSAGKELFVFCSKFEQKKEGEKWVNTGTCDFKLFFENKYFGNLSIDNIKNIVEGKTIQNKKGDKLVLDLEKSNFLHFTSAPDEDL